MQLSSVAKSERQGVGESTLYGVHNIKRISVTFLVLFEEPDFFFCFPNYGSHDSVFRMPDQSISIDTVPLPGAAISNRRTVDTLLDK